MRNDERPQLPPSPVNQAKDDAHPEKAQCSIETQIRVQSSPKQSGRQNGRPHAISLQPLNEITRLKELLKKWIDNQHRNDEKPCDSAIQFGRRSCGMDRICD